MAAIAILGATQLLVLGIIGEYVGRILHETRERAIPEERFYFEVLLGVQQQLWKRWKDAGHSVRVYVPYGEDWHAYSMRRLTRNPQLARNVLRAMLRRQR